MKYAVCSFQKKALSWWSTHVKAVGKEAVKAMKWDDLRKLMIKEFCPKNEMQKLDEEFWNLSM